MIRDMINKITELGVNNMMNEKLNQFFKRLLEEGIREEEEAERKKLENES